MVMMVVGKFYESKQWKLKKISQGRRSFITYDPTMLTNKRLIGHLANSGL